MTVGLPTPKARTASPNGTSLHMGEEGFPPLFGNCSAQGVVPQVGGKGKRQRWKWQRSPCRQLLLICGAHVFVSTVAAPSGSSRSCEWPERLLANSSGWKERARGNSDCGQRQGSWTGEMLFISLWHKENGKGSSAVFHFFSVFEDLVEGLN